MTVEILVPVDGCWVRRRNTKEPLGLVLGYRKIAERIEVEVSWGGANNEWVSPVNLESGFQPNWAVQDVPISATRSTLGQGRVISRRELGGREQLLVQLDDDGRSIWLPYENLRRLKDTRMRYIRAETGMPDHAERFRLKMLAHALENWNYLTGALDRLDVDPLPHQIQLVHRILSSGNHNWLIADDVGLGKTIEVGLLLAALKRRGQARRVLIISPAGLTRQWQDELQFKFDQQYEIYGRDFFVNKPAHWKLHDQVIASIDLAKRDEHVRAIQQAGGWDVVVFDEGHKLTRYADGERAQRYKLAEILRPVADAFLLLSGTPHQGYADRFIALLELVRPDLKPQIHSLEMNPEIVGEMILRNRKSEVTDADGNFIFKGQQVHRIPVEPSDETRQFQKLLRDYLKRGYKAGDATGAAGRAIGFVMTTYRKLASSSIAAIERALELRRERLNGAQAPIASGDLLFDSAEGDDNQDDLVESVAHTKAEEFFAFERDLIKDLLSCAKIVRKQDEKILIFIEKVVTPLLLEGKKLLVFTEYIATQSYIKEALERNFKDIGNVLVLNGSLNLDEKLHVIEQFNNGPNKFLISTEAGGEGLNLHRACHVMVNYDLPWNPARLVQRIGRLYRYGQNEPVIVFNLHARDSFDNAAIDLMMVRVGQIVQDMAPIGAEFNSRFYADILGDILDHLDFSSILQSSTTMEIQRTREQMDDAIARARQAKQLQDEILKHVISYDPNALRGTLGFTMQQVSHFIRGMLPLIDAAIENELYEGRVLEVRLPEGVRGKFPEFAQRTVVRITTERRLASEIRDVVLLDFETEFFQYLIGLAKSQKFDGIYASIKTPGGTDGMLAAFKLRWQNDQGEPVIEEFVSLFRDDVGTIECNPPFLATWLVSPLVEASVPQSPPTQRSAAFDILVAEANRQLAAESTRFKHPNSLVQLAVADCYASTVTD